jgi:hypothetical protein
MPRPFGGVFRPFTVRLVVYPPGIDRARIGLLHAWGLLTSGWGVLLCGFLPFLVAAFALDFARPWNLLVVPAIYAATLGWLRVQTRSDRTRSREAVWRFTVAQARALDATPPRALTEALARFDQLEQRDVDPVLVQRVWHDGYEALPPRG